MSIWNYVWYVYRALYYGRGCPYGRKSENTGGPPKWMIYFMEIPMKMDDLEVLLPRNLTAGTWSHDGFQVRNLQTSRDFGLQVNHVKFQGKNPPFSETPIWMVWDLGQGHRIGTSLPPSQVAYLRGRRCKSDATDKLQVAERSGWGRFVEICGFLVRECGISRSEVR